MGEPQSAQLQGAPPRANAADAVISGVFCTLFTSICVTLRLDVEEVTTWARYGGLKHVYVAVVIPQLLQGGSARAAFPSSEFAGAASSSCDA